MLLNTGGLTIFNFSFVLDACFCCCDCCCKVSGIDQSDSFDTHSECDSQGLEGSTQVFEVLKEVLYGFDGILSNFLQVFSLFSILAKLLPSVLPVCFTELKSFSIYSVKSSSSLSSPSSLIRPLFALAMWRVRTSLSMWPSKSDPT